MLSAVIVGCGAMSNGWIKAIQGTEALKDQVRIVGLVDLDDCVARNRAVEHGLTDVAIGTDLEAVLSATKPDLVFDIVVPAARRSVVETAFAHGCHVLSEKPMANSLAEAKALVAAARKSGKVHAIVQNRRHLADIRRVKSVIDAGTIGEVTAVHADFFIAPHFGGFRDAMDHVLLLDMAIHTFDAARYLMPGDPVGVYAQETNPKGSWYKHGASANALFEFSDGSTFSYRGSWCAEGLPTSWEASWRIIGTRGTLLWDGNDGLKGQIVTGDDGFLRPTRDIDLPLAAALPAEGHAGVILDFVSVVAAMKPGITPLSVNTDNIKSFAMVMGAIESAETGRHVTIDLSEGQS